MLAVEVSRFSSWPAHAHLPDAFEASGGRELASAIVRGPGGAARAESHRIPEG